MELKPLKNLTWWEVFLRVKEIAVFFGVLSLIIIPFQINDFINSENNTSVQLMLHLDDELAVGANPDIIKTAEIGDPILKGNGGRFTQGNLDGLLNTYEELGTYYRKNLVPLDLACDWFGADIGSILGDQEIKYYIADTQADDPRTYQDLTKLGKALSSSGCYKS